MKKSTVLFLFTACLLLTVVSCSKDDDEKNEQPSVDLTVITSPVTDLTAFSAKGGGSISGSQSITERGICWNTSGEPTMNDEVLKDDDPVAGSFSLVISDLEPKTNYFLRAYALTSTGEVVYGNSVNISTQNIIPLAESNSYIAGPNDIIIIPVSRANKSDIGKQIDTGEQLTAELIWMDNVGVIGKVATYGNGETGNIVVSSGDVYGNAVVALKVNNKTVWSWHIWVVEDPSNVTTITMPSGAKLMDRNLGATTKTISEIGAVGVQFQFGRKDPFTASASFGSPSELLLYDLAEKNPEIEKVDGPRNLAFATANPHTFIKSAWVDWCDENITTWWESEDGSKTVYDPCPTGWRVPAIEDFSELADEHFDKSVEGGHNFIFNNQSNYFAFTGYREVEGNMDATANYGTYWVNSVISGDAGIGSALGPSFGVGGTAPINGAPRARALSIRCVRE